MTPSHGNSGPTQKRDRLMWLVLCTLVLGIVSVFIENVRFPSVDLRLFTNVVDFSILFLFLSEVVIAFFLAPNKKEYFRNNLFNITFLLGFSLLFAYNKYLLFSGRIVSYRQLPLSIVIIRTLFVLFKVLGRIRRLTSFIRSFSLYPARTVMISFALAVITGAALLIQPFSTADQQGLSMIDSLFTATSAVCVTGLVVVDTGAALSIWGQIVVLALIQIGGLGIMILSYFGAFMLRRRLSLEDKLLISYMLSEKDMSGLSRNLKSIIYITFCIEGAGFLFLFIAFSRHLGIGIDAAYAALFHSISAFCNAGFSLYTNSLEAFKSDVFINAVIAFLIICGGISFPVIINLLRWAGTELSRVSTNRKVKRVLSLNTKTVLITTAFLLVAGMFLFYVIEHRNTLLPFSLKTQYISAFFQSVTLRTAGFNTVDMTGLTIPAYLMMCVFMFIGGASGSTAGGVKVNSVAVLFSYLRSVVRDKPEVTMLKHSLSRDLVVRTFIIFLFGISAASAGTFLLSLTVHAPLEQILFEAVSAFGTVGLSAGITPLLTASGKCVIIVLMFMGRIGPLTILSAVVQRGKRVQVEYPRGDVLIG